MAIQFSNGSVIVNNVPVAIMPNSLKIVDGSGEIKVRAMSAGGGAIETVHTEDVESKIGKISFELAVTDENRAISRLWKANIGSNVIVVVQEGLNPIVLQTASMVNDPEWEATADGKASIEFQGNPTAFV